jgi:hypothetical protein
MARWLILSVAVLLGSGCSASGTGAHMQGTITLDGQPIPAGSITVLPLSGTGQPTGGQFTGGKYSLDNVPLGKVNVMLQASKETGETYDDNGTTRKVTVPLIPAHYAAGIEKEIVSGKNEHSFALTSQPQK